MHSDAKSWSVKSIGTVAVGGVGEVTGAKRRGGSGWDGVCVCVSRE